ncbi:uncharacterized protein I303_107050 [Kwoniella dejecticola CBS 10117]|uniref:Uncharacterized protein n=1 Tax=Kwoniella dejecticola CBS 10117 TaxID=1296121 RepID=A0A1A5ZYL4_9TREE|nr:uncharacterized protein I303_06451 [Kwoniella dejecticola CBS 10117]OBR82894.1 hypothetical protein I303_06451 [Kwoniella dejecticola CBS 10117]
MSAPRSVPPAPTPVPVPLPAAQNVPIREPTQKKYSEGSMYEDMSPEDIKAWHDRYANFKKWREEVPNKTQVGQTFSDPPGKDVGVGSYPSYIEPSDDGTVLTTIKEKFLEAARARSELERLPNPQTTQARTVQQPQPSSMKKVQSRTNLQARVEKLRTSGTETPPSRPPSRTHTVRPPLSQKPVPSQNVAPTARTQPVKALTIEIQPPSTKTPTKTPLASQAQTQTQTQKLAQSQQPSDSHRTPSRKPSISAKPVRPPPTPLLAHAPAADKTLRPATEPKVMSRPPSTRGSYSPGAQIVPSPTPSAKYAEREAYISSALTLPLDMLVETEAVPAKVDTSSHLTTGRLDSLLGKSRSGSRNKGSQRSAGSSTTLPSPRSDHPPSRNDQRSVDLARSKTTSDLPTHSRAGTQALHEGHRYEGSNHLPLPDVQSTKPKVSSEATITRAANQPLPPTTHISTHAAAPAPPKTSNTKTPKQPDEYAESQTTIIRAAREPLPLSAPNQATHAETIKVPLSVKTALASSGPATRAPPTATAATVTRAGQIPLPATTGGIRTQKSAASTIKPIAENTANPASPRNVPLPPTAQTTASSVAAQNPAAPAAPSHRSQKPLRPALTPQHSFDALTHALSLGRRQRDPSVGDLTAHFEPAVYPLPPSGGTLFSSPEQVGNIPIRTTEHEVAFSTVQYIPPESLHTTTVSSTPAAQHSIKPRSNQSNKSSRSVAPPTPATRAAVIPLPPSTFAPNTHSTPRVLPSAPAPSSASPPAPPPPPVTSPVERPNAIPSSAIEVLPPRPSSHHPATNPPVASQVSVHQAGELDDHPHIHFSPGQVSQSLRSDDDHVSFEVPSGSRGRLRVTLKWFRDGHRSARSSPRAAPERLSAIAETEDPPPPPLPPKTTSLMSRILGRPAQPPSTAPQSRPEPLPQSRSRSTTPPSPDLHLIPDHQRPHLSPPPMKRDHPKSPTGSDQYRPHNPYYNQYYSGGLPAYAQVYNMLSPPLPYRQPGAQRWAQGPGPAGPYRQAQPMTHAQTQTLNQPQPQLDAGSPARESVDPPSDAEPPQQPQMPQGYPQPPIMGVNGFPQQPYWAIQHQQQQQQQQSNQSIWQRMFRKTSQQQQQQQQEDNLRPEDSVTIRNWARGVAPGGKAPTMLPQTTPFGAQARPTILPQQQQGGGRPTLAGTAYPNQGNNVYSGPGTTLYNLRGGYPPDYDNRTRRGRGREPSVWEKIMYRRQRETEEAVYRSPPRRRKDLPSPAPPPRHAARRGLFGRNLSPSDEEENRHRDRDRTRTGRNRFISDDRYALGRNRRDDIRDQRADKFERYNIRQREKEERRRQRSLKRDARANANATGLRREVLVNVDPRDRPLDVGGTGRTGRSGTLVGEWVGKFGRGRQRGQRFPTSESRVRNYQPETQPRLWKDRIPFTRRPQAQAQAQAQYSTYPVKFPQQTVSRQGQPRMVPGGQADRRQTLRRTMRVTERIAPLRARSQPQPQPQPSSGNALGLGLGFGSGSKSGFGSRSNTRQREVQGQTLPQGQGMKGMLGRLNLGNRTTNGRR